MKYSQKLVLAILSLVLIMGIVAGCGKSKTSTATTSLSPGDIKIGFIVKQPDESWFINEWKFAQKAADKYGFKLVTIGGSDPEKALAAIDNLAAQGAQGVIICTPDVQIGQALVSKAQAHNMKLFTVDDQLVGSDGKALDVPYMGISARNIGEQVGKTLAEEYKKRGWKPEDTAACAMTVDELTTAKERTDGAADALIAAGFPKDRIYKGAQKGTEPTAMDAAGIVLTQHSDVKHWLVFSSNDEGVLGGIRAMEGRGLSPDAICGVGIGGSTAAEEFSKSKPTGFYATVLISPKRHGYETAEMVYKWIKEGKEPPKDTRTTGIVVTRATIKQAMKDQGLTE